jgi:hypothetical protein
VGHHHGPATKPGEALLHVIARIFGVFSGEDQQLVAETNVVENFNERRIAHRLYLRGSDNAGFDAVIRQTREQAGNFTHSDFDLDGHQLTATDAGDSLAKRGVHGELLCRFLDSLMTLILVNENIATEDVIVVN